MFCHLVFFLMIRRPPRSTLSSSSAASDVYKRQEQIISVDSHAEVIGKIGDLVRGRLTAIPSKTAPSLALEQKQVVCKEIVEHEIRECLSELARVIIDDKHFDGKESPEETGS